MNPFFPVYFASNNVLFNLGVYFGRMAARLFVSGYTR